MITVKRPSFGARPGRRSRLYSLVLAGVLGTFFTARTANADDSSTDYCKKTMARANADAALLFAPTAMAQVIRFPQSAFIDPTAMQLGRDVQPRGAVSIGFVDIYKGVGVIEMGKKDCLRQDSLVRLQEVIVQRDDLVRRTAVERKLGYLRSREGDIEAVLKQVEDRFQAGAATLIQVREVRRKALELSAKATEAEMALEGMRKPPPGGASLESLDKMVTEYEAHAVAYEKSVEHVRNLAPWKLGVTAGVIPAPEFDYFGVVELSYNFGGLFQLSAESRAVAARTAELKNARYELRAQVAEMKRQLAAQADVLRRRTALLQGEMDRVARERASIEATDAPAKAQMLAALTLESIDLEAERIFLNALADRQGTIGGGK